MPDNDNEPTNCIGRRHFIKSLFGLGGGVVGEAEAEAAEVKAKVKPRSRPSFFWADLDTGFIGFPTGLEVPRNSGGSIMKLVAAAALSETGAINPNQTFECSGRMKVRDRDFSCQYPHGQVNLTEAIGLSCNVYFLHASEKLTSKTFMSFARKFLLDQPIAGHASGASPIEGKLSRDSFEYVLGLADDMQPNLLQLMRMAALIARRGDIPFLHSAEEPADGKARLHVELSDGTWNRLQQGMHLCTRQGTAKRLDPENVMHLAAKTGTVTHGKKFQSNIIGFFPFEKPKHAFALASPAGTSQESAVPQARQQLFSIRWP